MSFERPLSIAQQVLGSVWVTVMAFLALAEPAHAAFGSEAGAMLFQVVGAALASALFAARRALKQQVRRGTALIALWTSERDLRSRVAMDAGEHAESHS